MDDGEENFKRNKGLILTNEIKSSADFNTQLLKISNLIKKKYLNKENNYSYKDKSSLDKEFIAIK